MPDLFNEGSVFAEIQTGYLPNRIQVVTARAKLVDEKFVVFVYFNLYLFEWRGHAVE
jgi:thiazole synthase ThiGH ThiG subunit